MGKKRKPAVLDSEAAEPVLSEPNEPEKLDVPYTVNASVESAPTSLREKALAKQEARKAALKRTPGDAKPKVALRVFIQIHGAKADQLAGFHSYAKRNNLGPMTVEEWRVTYSDFMGKPVR